MPARWSAELDERIAVNGPGAFAYRRSAAATFRLDAFPGASPPEVAVCYPRCGRGDVTRLRNLRPGDIVIEAGRPTTDIARTLVDLGTVCGADLVERAAECALRRRLLTEGDLRALAASKSLRGLPVLREVVARRPLGAPPTGSDAETLVLQLCRRVGLPDPVRQLPHRHGGRFRIDLAWPTWRVAVEVDGREWHDRTYEQFVNDRRRQNDLTMARWLLLRFTWDDINDAPDRTAALLTAALLQNGWPGR